ncbi:MAG: YVTN family beta-propeller repeat-containing protein [Chitinivibrionales bacterium]|nr:YVTN family beta-propeller repeat-containing protein [Chitinivibrionales bacterium]
MNTQPVPVLLIVALLSFAGHVFSSGEPVSPGFITELLFMHGELPGVNKSEYLSPSEIAVSPDEQTLYVAEKTARRIDFVNATSGAVEKSVAVPKAPSGLAVSHDGARLYVSCYADDRPVGIVSVIATLSGALEKDIPAGHSCRAPVVSPDGSKLYVCNRFADLVSVIDISSGNTVAEIPVTREPYAAALTPDGSKLVVTNYLPTGRSDVDVRQSCVTIINTSSNSVEADILLTNGAQSLAGITISPDGRYAYISHVRSNHTMTPLFPIEGGWINANGFSVVDIENNEYVNVVLLDDPFGGGAANPCGITCDANKLVITTAGSHEIHLIDRNKLHEDLENIAPDQDLSIDLTFSQSFTKRRKVSVKGPRALAVAGTNAFVAGYFSDKIEVYDISGTTPGLSRTITLGSTPDMQNDIVRWGEFNFCDASPRICQGSWQSCHSCHPFVRSDALKWDLENDGVGNFKNDKSLLYAHITPPSMITGVRERAEVATRKGVELILFIDPGSVEPEASAIDAYLRMQRAVPSPHLENGLLSENAKKGKVLFEQLECDYCHPANKFYTDMIKHPGVKGPDDHGTHDGNWDTPTLNEVWRTAPFMHDGRCATMQEVYKPPLNHGVFQSITDAQINELAEFVNSL